MPSTRVPFFGGLFQLSEPRLEAHVELPRKPTGLTETARMVCPFRVDSG
jgi:hypothetical protein